jgi:dihydroxycyclohexadiene carboxylate dehydrogenase
MSNYRGRFAGKIAMVTGAAQGIGHTVAQRLAREGAAVALVDRSDLVAEAAHQAEALGAATLAVTADLESFEGAADAVAQVRAHFGRIDILVNNVGGTIWAKPYTEYAPEQIEAEIRRSLFPTLWCCRVVLPAMLESGAGVIVNVSSVATRGVNRVPYAAAKGGVNAITACLAWEYAQHGIRRLRCCPRRHRGAAAARGAQQHTADRAGEGMAPTDRRSDGLFQPDEALRHHRGAGGGHSVPCLG